MEQVKVLEAGVFKGHTLYLTTPIHTKFAWMKHLIKHAIDQLKATCRSEL